jgi:hypothetical protein
MQWEKGPTGNYLLVEDSKTLATVSINHGSSIFRISSPVTQRALLLHKEGFWKNKIALKNEYGHKLGQLYPAKWNDDGGMLELEGKKFRYKLRNNPLAEIVVLDETGTIELLTCGLHTSGNETGLRLNKNGQFADADLQYILFALAWYIFLPIAQENIPGYALSAAG